MVTTLRQLGHGDGPHGLGGSRINLHVFGAQHLDEGPQFADVKGRSELHCLVGFSPTKQRCGLPTKSGNQLIQGALRLFWIIKLILQIDKVLRNNLPLASRGGVGGGIHALYRVLHDIQVLS